MKKVLTILLILLVAGSLFAGGGRQQQQAAAGVPGPHGLMYAADQTLRVVYHAEATSLNWLSTADSALNWHAVSQAQTGLVSTDQYRITVPALAESWSISPDGNVYTFNLRRGLPWVDYQFNIIGHLTAHDFVESARWTLTPENLSSNTNIYVSHIRNAAEYYAGTITDFNQVGWRALDDYTLQVTLVAPRPFFLDIMGAYTVAYAPFLRQQGRNFGVDHTRLSYIGPYVITVFEPDFRRIYEKNPHYWDAGNVHIERVVATYNAQANMIAPELFLRGETDFANIDVAVLDRLMQDPQLSPIVVPGEPSHVFMYYYIMNFWPNFDERHEPRNWNLAVNNLNFRRSLYWAFNRRAAIGARDPFNGEMMLLNTITPWAFATVDGIDYLTIPPINEVANRPNWQFEPDRARSYRDAAIRELTAQGVTFPVKILLPYDPNDTAMGLEVQIVSQQLMETLGSQYIEVIIEAGPMTNFLGLRREGEFAMLRSRNGAVAPSDPESWSYAFERGMNWSFPDLATGPQTIQIMNEYYRLLDIAKSNTLKNMDRYRAFAVAETFLLDNAIVIPFSTDTEGYYASRTVVLDGMGDIPRWKGQRVLSEPLRGDAFLGIYENWLRAREGN